MGALYRAKHIYTNFDEDVNEIETTFLKAGYPKKIVRHTTETFQKNNNSQIIRLYTILFPNNKGKFTSSFLSVNPMKHLQRNSSRDSILSLTTSTSLFPGGNLGKLKLFYDKSPKHL